MLCLETTDEKGIDRNDIPLVSIVIPVYQVESWLRKCIDSVILQTFKHLEVILVDDGSTDSCRSICDEYASIDLRVLVVHQRNGGLGHARNIGMDLAHGKYIIFLDSDDYWKLETVEHLCLLAERDQAQVIAFAANVRFDDVQPFQCIDYCHTVQNGVVKSGPDSLRIAKKYHEYYSQACMRFYLLDYLRENNLRFDEGIIHEDESFSFLAYLCANRVECIGERFYTRRYHPGSIMMTMNPMQSANGIRTAMETVFRYTQQFGMTKDVIKLCADQMKGYAFSIYSLYRKCKKQRKNSQRKGQSSGYSNANEIAILASETFCTISRMGTNLPLWFRTMLNNFWSGYVAWLCWRCVKKGINTFNRLVRKGIRKTVDLCRIIKYRTEKVLFPWQMERYCPCCGIKCRAFALGNYTDSTSRYNPERYKDISQEVLCPICGSLPRHRILALWSEGHLNLLRSSSILYFAPEYCMMQWMKKNQVSCVTADLFGKADLRLDIQNTGLLDESYNMVFCNHVLEHVDDFRQALREIYRILRVGGSFVCSFPMLPGIDLVDEDPSVQTEAERLARFGQVDHQRVFGMNADRLLAEAGFKVERICGEDYPDEIMPVVGPADYDMNVLFHCVKQKDAERS